MNNGKKWTQKTDLETFSLKSKKTDVIANIWAMFYSWTSCTHYVIVYTLTKFSLCTHNCGVQHIQRKNVVLCFSQFLYTLWSSCIVYVLVVACVLAILDNSRKEKRKEKKNRKRKKTHGFSHQVGHTPFTRKVLHTVKNLKTSYRGILGHFTFFKSDFSICCASGDLNDNLR